MPLSRNSAPSVLNPVRAITFTQLFPVHDEKDPVQRIIAAAIVLSEEFPHRYTYRMDAISMIGEWLTSEEGWSQRYSTAHENWATGDSDGEWKGDAEYPEGLLLACLAGVICGKTERVDDVLNSNFETVSGITVATTAEETQAIVWEYIDGITDLPFAWWANLNYCAGEPEQEKKTA